MFLHRILPGRLARPFLALAAAIGLAACDPVAFTGPTAAVDPNAPVRIALMVPLGSGDSATDQLAQSLVNAARMAQRDLSGVNVEITVYETGGNPATATAAATRAISEGAQIIVGPLFSSTTSAVAQVARPAGVNVLSFSNNTAVAGGNVYVLGVTFETVADRLIGHAVAQGRTRFGIVYQDNAEGQVARDAVSTAAGRRGGAVVATASYPLQMQGLSARAAPIASELRSSGANAVFFTDSPTGGLGFIAAAMAQNNFQSGREAQFLGLTRWDVSDDVLVSPSLRGGWFAVPDPALTVEFETRYQLAHDRAPHALAPLAYDAVAAVGAMIREARAAGSRDAFSAAQITSSAGFAGVTGVFRLLPDGRNQRALAVMEVGNGVATVVSPAPRSFAAPGL